jgi:predicted nuclease of predicted toxin-antitoxin system
VSALLFDENLSRRLVPALSDVYPESTHVRLCGLGGATDRAVFTFARDQGYIIVSRDADFEALSVGGAPPKVIVLRIPDGPAAVVEGVLRRQPQIHGAGQRPAVGRKTARATCFRDGT